MTDGDGRYRFITIKPGAYPWRNHPNAWRPAHIHLSLFGPAFATRLVTQMYFPGDPLFAQDPIFNSVRDPRDRELMVSRFDLAETVPEWALGYRFDIVLRGRDATPVEGLAVALPTPSQTVGPFFSSAFPDGSRADLVAPDTPGAIEIEGGSWTARASRSPTR